MRIFMSVLACLAALTVAAPVHAGEEIVADPARDAVRVTTDPHQRSPEPREKSSDIVEMKTSYEAGLLVIQLRLRDLVKSRQGSTVVVRTPRGSVRHGMSRGPSGAIYFHGGRDRCGNRFRFDYNFRRDTIRYSLHTSCLGNPAWVRTGWEQGTAVGSVPGDAVSDDARLDGRVRRWGQPRLGPRVHAD